MTSYQNYLKNLFKRYKIYPSKRLGQNFLIKKEVVGKIIEAANLQKKDIVLEIGPGAGTLTQEIAQRAKKVIAVEKDKKMVVILKEMLEGWNVKNVEIVWGDILKIENGLMVKWLNGYKVVANLPFYLTAPLIRKFLESENPPKEMILVVQKEVAQRICAKSPDMNLLAVSVQFYAKPEIIDYISRNNFWPQPKVDGAIIKIVPCRAAPHRYLRYGAGLREQFFKIVRSGFSHPRKQILNNLAKDLNLNKEKVKAWLLKNKIQPSQRAETLTIKDWLFLTKSF
jgi:16S rRNA (adenine1518-N6/adenine1519-N6)-dimethyltransferase